MKAKVILTQLYISVCVIAVTLVPMKLSAEEKSSKKGPPPPRGEHLVTTGKALFFGGLAGIGTAAVLARTGSGNDGVHPNPLVLVGGLLGTVAVIASPFVYFPGKARERDYHLWKQGKYRMAQHSSVSANPDDDSSENDDNLSDGISGESARNRIGKHFGLHLNAFGSEGGNGNSIGLIFSSFLTSNSLLELNIAGSQNTSFRDKNLESRLTHQLATLRLTQFYGNSFFVTYGVGVRRFQGAINFTESKQVIFGDASQQQKNKYDFYKVKQQDMGVEIALGNRWQWQNFSMGFDWLGLYLPVYKFVADRQRDANPPTASAKTADEAVDDLDFKRRWGLEGLRFHLGSTF